MSASTEESLDLSYAQIRELLDARELRSEDLTQAALNRARHLNSQLRAYLSYADEMALTQAREADARLDGGERNAVLGIPFATKDLIVTRGQPTTAGSRMLQNFIPPYQATVMERLLRAGAPCIGKTHLDEFGMGSSNENTHMEPCRNPWNLERTAGGSSGGSAVAVASASVPWALGTDTGGSIRQPASFTGITGLKPTYGRVSRYGLVAFASSLDHIGPMALDALGCAAMLETIAGFDKRDATSSRREVPPFLEKTRRAVVSSPWKSVKVGKPREFWEVELDPQLRKIFEETFERFQDAGAEIVDVSLPHLKYSLPTYYLICSSEVSSNLARYDGVQVGARAQEGYASFEEMSAKTRQENFGAEVQLRILLGTYALSSGYYEAYFHKAAQVRRLISEDFRKAFERCDVLASPTSPTTAFALGSRREDPLSMYLSDIYTLAANLAGIPALSFNVGWDMQNLPVGFQLMAPWWSEENLLAWTASYQKQHPKSLRRAPRNGK